jgi:hypothetical protein
VDRADKTFIFISGLLLALISVVGSGIEFTGLEWNLVSTPGGMIYSSLFGGEKLTYWFDYLIRQQTSPHGDILQVLLSVIASSTGLKYIAYRSDMEVEFK